MYDDDNKQWREGLKVGDEVVLDSSGQRDSIVIAIVSKVTSKQIHTSNGKKFWIETGCEVAAPNKSWYFIDLRPVTEEVRVKIRRLKLVKYFQLIVLFNRLSDESLEKIYQIVREDQCSKQNPNSK